MKEICLINFAEVEVKSSDTCGSCGPSLRYYMRGAMHDNKKENTASQKRCRFFCVSPKIEGIFEAKKQRRFSY
jgi:hypothetical protein